MSIPTDPVATATAYKAAAAGGREARLHGQRSEGIQSRQGLRLRRFRGQLRQRCRLRASDGQGARRPRARSAWSTTRPTSSSPGSATTASSRPLSSDYPSIQIVEEQGIAGPDFAGDAQSAANAMLSKHSDLAGIWAVWDVPAEGVMAAARASGRGDLRDRDRGPGQERRDRAWPRASWSSGWAPSVPFDQGVTEARLGALARARQEGAAVCRSERAAGDSTTTSWRPGSRSTTRTRPRTLSVLVQVSDRERRMTRW